MKRRIVSWALSFALALSLLPVGVLAAEPHPFQDVPSDHWANEAVQYAYDEGLMDGVGPTTFAPGGTLTRAMFVTILGRQDGVAEDSQGENPFTDVADGQWYTPYVTWAAQEDIVGGYGDNRFGPTDPITREQMAAILYRYAQYKGYDTSETGSLDTFPDAGEVSEYAVEPMAWTVGTSLIAGMEDNTLRPQGTATRAQAATVLMRFCKTVVEEPQPEPTTYIVTFDYNYGNKGTYTTVTVKDGQTVDRPDNPTRSGYTFAGWYTQATGGEKFDFDIAVTGDVTVYARWNRLSTPDLQVFTVTFESNGGSNVPSQKVTYGTCAMEPAVPTRAGYVFSGWYTQLSASNPFDFSSPIKENITLYAKWGIDNETDSDNDSLPDFWEEFLGTDPSKADTDGDGLSDYTEILIGTDPTLIDTDSNGTNDGDEDADEDGLTNLKEQELGTCLSDKDSDHDGLDDNDELNRETKPLEEDTDGDGALDGWEVANNYDPLVFNDSFSISKTLEDGSLSVSVRTNTSGENLDSLSIEPIETLSLNKDIPGYIGSAFDFAIDGTIEQATISFSFDSSLLETENFDPVIYYFNEETQLLEPLETTVSGNTASTTVTHFSSYILLNRTEFDAVWEAEIKPPSEENSDSSLDVVFVIDYSYSMATNDPDYLCKSLSKEFVDKLRDGVDRAGAVKFIRRADVVHSLTGDKESLNSAIDSIIYNPGHGDYAGTNGSAGLKAALDMLLSSKATYKYVIFLTDGQDTYHSYSYDELIDTANTNDISIYTIGMGNATANTLQEIASKTDGKFYYATTSTALKDIYDKVSAETIDYSTDSNNDGISDYHTKHLCDGTLKISTKADNPFYGYSYDEVQSNADFDHDGLLNGQELVIQGYKKIVRAWVMSDPTSADSDYDGIDDNEDPCLFEDFIADVKYSIGGNSYDTTASFKVDYRWFFEDNTSYNQDLAVLASLLSLDMYNDGWLELTKGASGSSVSLDNGISLGKIFGQNDGKNISASELATTYATADSNGRPVDASDISEAYIGHRLVSYGGEQREIFFLTIRGTNATFDEWSSNFDIGANDSSYYDKTGVHPDWTNYENHKGFDVTATRILRAFNAYVSELESLGKIDSSAKRSIFITGHSRGAAIANILGAYFENAPQYDSYVYTMAAPNTTTSENAHSYQTIFNIVNREDLIPYLPLYTWGFDKYGETILTGTPSASHTFDIAFLAFANMSRGRSDFYVLDTTSGDGVVIEGALHSDNGVAYRIQEIFLERMHMDSYCKLRKVEHLGLGYTIEITYCPAYVAQNLACLASRNDLFDRYYGIYGYANTADLTFDLIGIDLKGKYSNARTAFLKHFLISGMEVPHVPTTYYRLSSSTDYIG